MNLISLLGLLALLGIAWALSVHKTRVPLRTVAWGLGLQFLFAVIILREDFWSFVGMAVFGLLLVVYIVHEGRGWGAIGALAAAAAAVGLLLHAIMPALVPWVFLALFLFLPLNARFRFAPGAQRFAAALLVVAGVTYLTSRGLYGQLLFSSLSTRVSSFLSLSDYGAAFIFGNLANPEHFGPGANWPGFGMQFGFKVLPTIIFFGGFMAVLYYLGVMQKVIEAMSRFVRWTLGTSGAETLSCSANIFVGQTEAPLLIRPFLPRMTKSELNTIMVGGFATIAGGVLAGYIAFGVPAGHLIAASVMSAPAALVIGKIIYPETEHSETAGDVKLPEIDSGGNVIEAASNGITDGLKLAVNVAAMLIGFIALIAVVDVILNWADSLIDGRWLGGEYVAYEAVGLSPAVGEYLGWFPGSLQTLFGTLLKPLAFLMGVPWKDATLVGNLLGVKLSLNEFVAYGTLGTYIQNGALSERAVIISTYALCGFANFASIGIQIGGISAVAPDRKPDLAKVGLKAMIGGALASWTTATIAGILIA
ncbi:MAG: nucleoside transporter C-terminal domain-containing protein [Thermoanaerobaculia bacterium]|nr:nucleoside transporter C-terminal domain-containing protein [Thermoanaerobaculia bacterium]